MIPLDPVTVLNQFSTLPILVDFMLLCHC